MGAEETGLDRHPFEAAGDAKHLCLARGVETVTRLDLNGRYALTAEAIDPCLGAREQILLRCRAGELHRRADPSARPRDLLIARSLKPQFELARPIAGVDQMGMAIDETGRQPASGE